MGTARPAHYFVLRNEMSLNDLDLRNFAFNTCFNYVRTTSGVSYAPPAYYADRLCERSRCYLRTFINPDDSLKKEYHDFENKLQIDYQNKRDKDPDLDPDKKESAREKVGVREERNRRKKRDNMKIKERCRRKLFADAKTEFYREKKDPKGNIVKKGNPWGLNVGDTMFWM